MDIEKLVYGLVLSILGIVVVFQLFAGTATTLINAGNNVSASGLPLAGLFGGSGIVLIIIVVGVLLMTVRLALKKN